MKAAIRIGCAVIAVFFGGFGGWAALAPLDGAIVAAGQLTVRGNRKTVQHRDGGVIAALYVAEGDHVRQGQVLIQLEDTPARAALASHLAAYFDAQAAALRAQAELTDAPAPNFAAMRGGPGDAAFAAAPIARETAMFRDHRRALIAQLGLIDGRLGQAGWEVDQMQAQYRALQATLSAATLRLCRGPPAPAGGAARALHALQSDSLALLKRLALIRAQATSLQADKARLRDAAHRDASTAWREAQARLDEIVPRLAIDRDALARLQIRAPVSGRVVDQAIFTTGGVIEPGRPILDIVPDSAIVVAQAEIRPEDIEYLRVGQEARVVATGFDPRTTLPLPGRIDIISADRVEDPRSGRAFYRAEILLRPDPAHHTVLARLTPGMPVDVIINVQPRTALEYLIEPLRSSLRQTGNEL